MNRESERLTPMARRQGLVIQRLDDEVLVYDLERHRAHCLNVAAAAIWEQCDGQTSVPEMAQRLQATIDPAVDEAFVMHGLAQLSKRRLLQQRVARGADLSRREALRRFGVAAAIGLPVVASILAPTAAEAVTCAGAGGTCGGPGLPCCAGCACINGVCLGTCLP
jgi:Coenzyme PQQ synthesis protein D (PqqD)